MPKSRKDIFHSFLAHPHLGKLYKKLSKKEIELCNEILEVNKDQSGSEFNKTANHVFLGKNDKPKNWLLIAELLSCTISLESQIKS